jgi:signal transduction histidine kinase
MGAECAVADVVGDTVSLLSKQFLGGIVLTLDISSEIPKVQAIPSRLEQILLNLIVNSVEAMAGQGKLGVAAHNVNGSVGGLVLNPRPAVAYVGVSVTDSGPGIASETLSRIFEPFFTTKNVGTSPGTGLGLSLVYTIAQQDGFGLGVESHQGKGTTFRVLVPVIEHEAALKS